MSIWVGLIAALSLGAEPGGQPEPLPVVQAIEEAVSQAIARVEGSVVAVVRERNSNGAETLAVRGKRASVERDARNPFDPRDLSDTDYLPLPGDFGSGVVIGQKGEVLTAFHVIQGSSRIRVRAAGNRSFEAQVIAADPRSDLAVLAPVSVAGEEITKLPPLALGRSEELRKGAFLVALGNPYNSARDGSPSASLGILSNTTRRMLAINLEKAEDRQAFRFQPVLLQLDSKLNLGMSGGAVVNLKGELVGITTTGGNAEGYDASAGYAIPMDQLGRRVVATLLDGREVEYGFLGIKLDPTAPNIVGGVEPGTPADRGDLVIGDVIEAVNELPVTAQSGLSLPLSYAEVGAAVTLKIRRAGELLEKTVFLSKFPTAGEVIATNRPPPWRGLQVDYASVMAGPNSPEAVLRAMAQGSVGVLFVEPDSAAAAAGLQVGRVITGVEGKPVRSPAQFLEAVKGRAGPVSLETPEGMVTVRE